MKKDKVCVISSERLDKKLSSNSGLKKFCARVWREFCSKNRTNWKFMSLNFNKWAIFANWLRPIGGARSAEASTKGVLSKKMFLEISQNLLQACNFIKKETLAQVFSCKFTKFLRTPYFIQHYWWLLLLFIETPVISTKLWYRTQKRTYEKAATTNLLRTILSDKY